MWITLCPIIQEQTNLTVIGEVQDGWEAFRQGDLLQPDLIFSDISAAAEWDRSRSSNRLNRFHRQNYLSVSKFFLEVVHEALALVAWGYVVKEQAGAELLAAVEAVVQHVCEQRAGWAATPGIG